MGHEDVYWYTCLDFLTCVILLNSIASMITVSLSSTCTPRYATATVLKHSWTANIVSLSGIWKITKSITIIQTSNYDCQHQKYMYLITAAIFYQYVFFKACRDIPMIAFPFVLMKFIHVYNILCLFHICIAHVIKEDVGWGEGHGHIDECILSASVLDQRKRKQLV